MAKALIVSSDSETRFTYEKAISFQGFLVRTANDIKKALMELKKQWPDLVVIDFDSHASEELEALRALKPAKKDLPVIIVTDLKKANEKKQACVIGACHYLSKSESTLGDLIKLARKAIK